jgi:succinate dehydrogenase hydrophobic anchor subunit
MKTKKPHHHRARPFQSFMMKVGVACLVLIYFLFWLRAVAMLRAGNYAGYTNFYGQPVGTFTLIVGLVAMPLLVGIGLYKKRSNRHRPR